MDIESYVLAKNYTDEQISGVGAPLRMCGSVPTYEDLPTEHAQGDVWHVTDTGAEWAWSVFDGEGRWEEIGTIATDDIEEDNPSPVSSGAVYDGLQEKASKSTTIAGVDLQDNIAAAELLAGLGMNNWNNTVRAADVYKNYKDLNSPHDFPHGIFLVEAGSMANTPSSPAQDGVLFNLHTHKDAANYFRGVQIFIEYLTSTEAGNRGYSSDMYIRNVIHSTAYGYVYDNYNGGWQKLTNRVDLSKKMDKVNPTGTGKISMNGGVASGNKSISLNELVTATGDGSIAAGLSSHLAQTIIDEGILEGTLPSDFTIEALVDAANKDVGDRTGDENNLVNAFIEWWDHHPADPTLPADKQFILAAGKIATVTGEDSLAVANRASAQGLSTVALGENSVSEGCGSRAMGRDSHAGGLETLAEGLASFAHGYKVAAANDGAIALGYNNQFYDDINATGKGAFSAGVNTTAAGDGSAAIGSGAAASAFASIALGDNPKALGGSSVAIGKEVTASHDNQIVLGQFSAETNAPFVIGGGTSSNNRSNLLEVSGDGVKLKNNFLYQNKITNPEGIKSFTFGTYQFDLSNTSEGDRGTPEEIAQGELLVLPWSAPSDVSGGRATYEKGCQICFSIGDSSAYKNVFWFRTRYQDPGTGWGDWNSWVKVDPAQYASNAAVTALEARVQALESALSGIVQRLEQI